jgi:hypothetical protein
VKWRWKRGCSASSHLGTSVSAIVDRDDAHGQFHEDGLVNSAKELAEFDLAMARTTGADDRPCIAGGAPGICKLALGCPSWGIASVQQLFFRESLRVSFRISP